VFFQKCRHSSEYHQTGIDLAWSTTQAFGFDVIEKPEQLTEEEIEELIEQGVRNLPGAAWKPVEDGLPGTRAQRTDARDRMLNEGRIVNLAKGENGTEVLLRKVENGKAAALYLPDDPAVAHLLGGW
jgi:hypothetical protein